MPNRFQDELAEIRGCIRQFQHGGKEDAVYGFRDLVNRLLLLTVMDDRCFIRPIVNPEQPSVFVLAGPDGVSDPLRLTNGHYLRLIIDLAWDGTRLLIEESTFQYQTDEAGSGWLFRYDFLRNRPDEKPEAHLHISGELDVKSFELPEGKWTLKDVHFPTAKRVSIESVIRLLADDFKVRCNCLDLIELGNNNTEELWRAVLRESERAGFY